MVDTATFADDMSLEEVSQAVFAGEARFRLVNPSALIQLRKNARFMSKAVFEQLTENIRRDGFLSSVPLCQELESGKLEVLSGNHRVQAAVTAGIETILVIVIPAKDLSRKIAIQLSHNALTGEDDQQLLTELWSDLHELNDRLYSGLDSEVMSELPNAAFTSINAAQPQLRTITLCFLPDEVEALDMLLDEADLAARNDSVYLAPAERYDSLFEALAQTRKTANIKNTTVAFLWLLNRLADRTLFESLDPNSNTDEATPLSH